MNIKKILSTHDLILISVKKQHKTFNATKEKKKKKNMPYLEGGKLLIELAIISPKVFIAIIS